MSRQRRPSDANLPEGILPVIKPAGPTSHDIVDIARRALRQKQIGHTGTLDPAATGVLVLCLGRYTKLQPYLVSVDKTYEGRMALGLETDTDDGEGAPLLSGDASAIALESIQNAAARLVGDIEQIPPRYAAIKIAGKKLYEYARENAEVEVPPRAVTVFEFSIREPELVPVPEALAARNAAGVRMPERLLSVAFECRVSSGTYVRALARDIGRALGCGGHLASLVRSRVGSVSLAQAVDAGVLQNDPSAALAHLIRGGDALDPGRFRGLTLIQGFMNRLNNGQPLNDRMMIEQDAAAALKSGTLVAIRSEAGALLAVASAERFDEMRKDNPYDSRYNVHFRTDRIFPGGLSVS